MPAKRIPKRNGKGRPSGTGKLRTPEHADYICEQLELGRTLRQIAKDLGYDRETAIVEWARDGYDKEFSGRYARSMVARWERMADELIEMVDEIAPVDALGHVDTGWVQQQRLRSDNRKWLLSKALPKKYGDKVTTEVTGDPNAPLLTRIELVAVPPRARIEDSDKVIEHEPDTDE
jgi:hypothetical protein